SLARRTVQVEQRLSGDRFVDGSPETLLPYKGRDVLFLNQLPDGGQGLSRSRSAELLPEPQSLFRCAGQLSFGRAASSRHVPQHYRGIAGSCNQGTTVPRERQGEDAAALAFETANLAAGLDFQNTDAAIVFAASQRQEPAVRREREGIDVLERRAQTTNLLAG